VNLYEMNWPTVAALSKTTPIVIPIAALEQHGRHMPVFTDSLLLGEVVRRAHERLKDRALFTPLMWLGNSEHHLDFPGTMTASPRVYLDLLKDMVKNFVFHDFTRIVLLNGHGGNIVPMQQALFEVRQEFRSRSDLLLLAATYWTMGGKPHEVDRQLRQQQMGHACEWETSMMLRIRPDLVGKDVSQVAAVSPDQGFSAAYCAWITKDRSAEGHIGEPASATAEKGETLFQVFSNDVVVFLEQVGKNDGSSVV
jgi:creatinine amidohydrolase